jgi:RimJ/RimL family protein N-acetyltransferase
VAAAPTTTSRSRDEDLRLRRAGPADAAAIAAGMKPVVDEARWLATQPSATAADLEVRFRAGMGEGLVFLVLERDAEVVGCAGLNPGDDGVWTLGTWLAAGLRGRGHGRRLLDAAVAAAVEEGARKVELEVFTDNEAAIALYRSAGFAVEDVRPDSHPREDGSLKSSIVMGLHPAERADSRRSLQSPAAVKRSTDNSRGAR